MIRRRRPHPWSVVPAAALLLLGLADGAAAQTRIAVVPEPRGTVVGVSVMLGAGSALEAEERLGAGHVAAQAVVEDLRPQLDALGGQIELACDRTSLRFTVLAPASTWWVATDLLLETIFQLEPTDRMIERARTVIGERLRAEEDNPEYRAQVALQEALFGVDHRWARAPCGRPQTVADLAPETVRRVRELRFTPERAAAAVVGPVDEARASRLLSDALGDVALPVLLPAGAPDAAPDRRVVERETVTTWTGLAFPLAPDADAAAVELLGFYLEDAFGPAPERPDVYGITTRLQRHGTSGALVVHLVTSPATADEWRERVRARIRARTEEPLGDQAFQRLLQRYRGARLLGLAGPDDRARDAVRQLFFDGAYRPPAEELDGLTRARLRRAAAYLSEPASARLGPGS